MRKILFNDRYGLTESVLDGTKTMFRRAVGDHMTNDDIKAYLKGYKDVAYNLAPYKIGEVVAVAQSYNDAGKEAEFETHDEALAMILLSKQREKGWNNKMFVRADLMPHQIRILDFKVERLQDISDEDCLKEGLIKRTDEFISEYFYTYHGADMNYAYIKTAFADLIDKVSGKGTWERNPYVFAYEFELVK